MSWSIRRKMALQVSPVRVVQEYQDREGCLVIADSVMTEHARLIAAAPQMLEALELAAKAFEDADVEDEFGFGLEIETTRAAIAAAKGEEVQP